MFVEGNGYADDCCVIFGGRKSSVLVRRLQRVLDQLVAWGETCGLRFNPDKTVVVNFSRKHAQLIPHLRIGGDYVPYSREAVYLGITLDDKLTWRKHLNNRIARSKKYLMKMSNISKAIWGPKPHLSRWVFRCVVRPMFTYASVIWTHSIDTPLLRQYLRRVNRLAISTYTLFPRSTPTQGVELLTDTFPLHLWMEKEALCAFVRLAHLLPLTWSGVNKNKRRNVAHRRFWSYKLEEYGLNALLLEVDVCYFLTPPLSFSILVDSYRDPEYYRRTLEIMSWRVWTDGSKQNNKVGSAFVLFKGLIHWVERKFRLPDTASVFQAELYAIFQAAVYLQETLGPDMMGDICYFYTDSLSALQALDAAETTSVLVRRTIQQLNILSESFQVKLVWVKAHIGIPQNETADRLAKEATKMNFITHVPLPRSQIRAQVLEKLRLQWKKEWDEYDEARHSKLFIFESSKMRGKQICSLNRIDLRRLIMGITNHNNLFYHQSLHDDTINPTCRFCRLFDETFDHFFTCIYFSDVRRELGITWPSNPEWTPKQLVSFINDTEIREALDRRSLRHIGTSEDRITESDSDVSMESVSGASDFE